MAEEIISKDNVTEDIVKSIFDEAYFETGFNENSNLFVKGNRKIWIDVNEAKTIINFSVLWIIDENSSTSDKIELAERINKEIILIKAVPGDETFLVEYDLWIEGGVTKKNIVFLLKMFDTALNLALKKDEKLVIK